MSKSLLQLKKDLKAFAKRCKDFKYTDSALFMFLLCGLLSVNLFSANATDSSIENQVHQINTSINQMRTDFKRAKAENNKLIKSTNLELTQLMEQGDQVVKSTWSSWQYGMNYFYNDWNGTYKGRGDKTDNVIYKRDETLGKYSYQTNSMNYGTTSLALNSDIMESPVDIEVDASLRTLTVNKQAPTFTPTTPGGGLPPFEPRMIQAPNLPKIPDNPKITVLDPPDLAFNGTGFGQGYSPSTNQSQLYVENYHIYNTTAPVYVTYTSTAGRTMTGGNVIVTKDDGTAGTTLTPGTSSSQGIYFINDAADHSVTINGDYDITRATDTGNGTLYFVSLNPYEVGRNTSTDAVYDFAGNLTLHGHNNPSAATVLLGFEHQLLANNGGGSGHYTNVENGTVTSILKNSGNITLQDGYNLVGIQIDTEYGTSSGGYFRKQPQTINEGTITINSQNSIGIDYGYYQSAAPNTKTTLGNINVNGSNSYGFRMKDYSNKTSGATYYDLTDITGGGTGKKITVKGTNNVGVSIAQGTSSGDPLSRVTGLNIEVGGTGNVGFLRNSQGSYANTNAMILNATTIGDTFNFSSDATESALIRSDKNEVKLDKDITVGAIGAKNTLLQAGKQGTVRLGSGKTVTSTSSDEFYGMTAGSFPTSGTGTTGATIINEGTLNIGGNKSIAMAVDTGNTGESSGIITYTGNNASAIFNKGTFEAKTGSTTTITGSGNTGIYNSGTLKLFGTVGMTLTNGSTGIFSNGGTITSAGNNVTISVDDSAIPTGVSKGVAVYARNGANVALQGANLTIKEGASGVVSDGSTLDLTNSTIDYDGDGYAIYNTNSGTVNLTNATLTLRGKAVGFQKDMSVPGSIITSGMNINVFSNDVTVMNLRNATGPLNLTGLNGNLATLAGLTPGSINNTDSAGITYNNYKLASIDGLNTYEIDKDLDKSLAVTGGVDTDVDTFVKNLLVQRAIVNVQAGKKVTSHLNTSDLTAIGAATVVGLDMSSSSSAASNNETQINLASGSTVSADRTDSGNGAVGLYINYGKINTDASATINVEKEANTVNDSAVGIYAVNGSEVNNQGTINVGGNSSIGLLGLAYREDSVTGAAKVNEFGGKPGEGTINLTNKGNVTLDGTTAYGIYVKNNNSSATAATAIGTNAAPGVLNLSGNNSIGMIADKGTLLNDTGAKINMTGQEQVGMYGKNTSSLTNNGEINLAASTTSVSSVGIYTDDTTTSITNNGKINGGNNTYGIFGKTVTHGSTGEITVGDAGVGIYSTEGNIMLNTGSKITVGGNEGVGVFTTGTAGRNITADTNMTIGDSSFGYVIKNSGTTTLTTNGTATLGNEAKFIYSDNKDITVTNNVALTSTGNNTYGIYSAGTVINNADIDFGRGTGSVGIYAINGGTATNSVGKTITVSGSNITTTPAEYGMGMATSNGTIINDGTIKVGLENGIGMFASGSGSKAINNGTIELSGKSTKGMYIDNNAVGENWGIIKTVPNPTNDGILGVVAANGGVIKNYGQIIVDGPTNKAGYLGSTGTFSNETSGSSTGTVTKTNGADGVVRKTSNPTSKTVAGIEIDAPAGATVATIRINGTVVTPTVVNTDTATPTPSYATVTSPSGATTIVDLNTTGLGKIPTNEQAGTIGMYIDTSGVNYTHPIQGLSNLAGLQKVNLIFGNEAARYTDSKVIEVGNNIIAPYNNMILSLAASGSGAKFSLNAGSLTWFATATQDLTTSALGKVYLVKIPYQAFAAQGDEQTYTFLTGLEERYGVETSGREKEVFNKLNNLGKGEGHILAQAIDEMKGHQYSNIQQRVFETGNVLSKEFDYLQNEWRNPTKDNNKIKVFGQRGQFKTDTAGVIDYTNDAYGVAYVHENETVKLGRKSGWYAGAVYNKFKFKDIGKSEEEQTMIKAGLFKTVSPRSDHNGSLTWKISGEAFAGRGDMKRRYWIVDEVFEAKGKYTTYGIALKNEIGKEFRTSENTSIRPYAALNLEYGRYSNFKETGPMALELKGNDYFSAKPEAGISFNYKQNLGVRSRLTASLTAAYENELGELYDVKNKAKLKGTQASHYELRGDKENHKGNGKFDLNLGWDNTRFGVTVNAGYDTTGENFRGGIGFRAIY